MPSASAPRARADGNLEAERDTTRAYPRRQPASGTGRISRDDASRHRPRRERSRDKGLVLTEHVLSEERPPPSLFPKETALTRTPFAPHLRIRPDTATPTSLSTGTVATCG